MATNNLALALIRYGIDPTGARAALREFHQSLIAAGPGASCGVHDVGVFFTQQQAARFIMRDDQVFSVPSRLVVKLRPSGQDATLLTESPLVRISIQISNATYYDWQFDSTSRSNRFSVVLPTDLVGDVWHFVRVVVDGTRSYVLCKNSFTGALDAGEDLQTDGPGGLPVFFRWTARLNNRPFKTGTGNPGVVGRQFTARVADDTATGNAYTGDDHGREALAWFRQRAIDESER